MGTLLASGVLLGWTLTGLVLDDIYPPYQITAAYLGLALFIGLWLEGRVRIDRKTFRPPVLAALAIAGVIIALSGFLFWHEMADKLRVIDQTIYPGRRLNLGGGLPIWAVYGDTFFIHAFVRRLWGPLSNVCEASSGLLFTPFLFLFSLADKDRAQVRSYGFLWAVLVYIGVLVLYATLGFPKWLALATLFSKLTQNRINTTIALADLCAVVWFLAKIGNRSFSAKRKLGVGAAGILLYAAMGLPIVGGLAQIRLWHWALALIALSFFFVLILEARARRFFMPLFAILCVLYTGAFNPMVRGGLSYLKENALSRTILDLNAKRGGNTKWVAFSTDDESEYTNWAVSNLFRTLGVRSPGGFQNYPDLEVFQRLDPSEAAVSVYNRTAHLGFRAADTDPTFSNPKPGDIQIAIRPSHSLFDEQKIDFFLVSGKNLAPFLSQTRLKKRFQNDRFTIFER